MLVLDPMEKSIMNSNIELRVDDFLQSIVLVLINNEQLI